MQNLKRLTVDQVVDLMETHQVTLVSGTYGFAMFDTETEGCALSMLALREAGSLEKVREYFKPIIGPWQEKYQRLEAAWGFPANYLAGLERGFENLGASIYDVESREYDAGVKDGMAIRRLVS
jgi:hypothetical protein